MRTVHGDCGRARQWASAEIDGELSEFERALLHAHLEGCGACAAFLAEARGLTRILRSAPPEHFQVGFEARRRSPVRFRLSPVAASLAVAAVGVGSILGAVRAWPGATGRQGQLASAAFASGPMNMRRGHGAWDPGANEVQAEQQQPQQPSHGPALQP